MNPRSLVLLLTLALTGPVHADSFTPGDLYLLTSAWPGVGNVVGRIDPVTGVTEVLHDLGTYPRAPSATYDPYRDRIMIMPDIDTSFFRFIAADGSYTDLANNWDPDIASWCPTGDGRIYLLAGIGTMAWLDANDVRHVLYDTDGVTPYLLVGFYTSQHMIYDVGTNSLIIASWGTETKVTKIPLSADGTRVAGPPVVVEFDAFDNASDWPMGISAGPNGKVFIKIRAESNAAGMLMFLVDPVTMQFSSFATIQHYFSAWNRPGTYNSTHALAFAIDEWNDNVRTYVDGGGLQAGSVHASGVSAVGARTFMLSIGDTINGIPLMPCGDSDGDGQAGVNDLLAVLAAWGPCGGCPEDFDGNGVVDVADLLFMLSTWGPC